MNFSYRNLLSTDLKTQHYNGSDPTSFSYPEPFLRAVRRGALAKSISNWHLIGYNEGYCSNTGYILLPCFYGIRFWPEPLVAARVRRALGTRMILPDRMETTRLNWPLNLRSLTISQWRPARFISWASPLHPIYQ